MTRVFSAIALVICATVTVPQLHAEPPPTELDLFDAMGLPPGVGPIMASQLGDDRGLPINVSLADAQGKPASRLKLWLRWKGGQEQVVTDEVGQLHLELKKDQLSQPRLLVPAGYVAEVAGGGVRVMAYPSEADVSDPAATLDLAAMPSVTSGDTQVYYNEGHLADALSLLGELQRIRGFAAGFAGLDVVASGYGVALVDREPGALSVQGRFVVPITLDQLRRSAQGEAMVYWPLVHEWVELSLLDRKVYSADPRMRMFGDGLAELLAFEYCRRYHMAEVKHRLGSYIKRMEGLAGAGRRTYSFKEHFRAHVGTEASTSSNTNVTEADLDAFVARLRENQEEAAGYAASFWLWNSVRTAGGPDSIRHTVDWLQATANPHAADFARYLREDCNRTISLEPSIATILADLNQWAQALEEPAGPGD